MELVGLEKFFDPYQPYHYLKYVSLPAVTALEFQQNEERILEMTATEILRIGNPLSGIEVTLLRSCSGLSTRKISEALGITKQAVNKWEHEALLFRRECETKGCEELIDSMWHGPAKQGFISRGQQIVLRLVFAEEFLVKLEPRLVSLMTLSQPEEIQIRMDP